jgi:hypothetical protein
MTSLKKQRRAMAQRMARQTIHSIDLPTSSDADWSKSLLPDWTTCLDSAKCLLFEEADDEDIELVFGLYRKVESFSYHDRVMQMFFFRTLMELLYNFNLEDFCSETNKTKISNFIAECTKEIPRLGFILESVMNHQLDPDGLLALQDGSVLHINIKDPCSWNEWEYVVSNGKGRLYLEQSAYRSWGDCTFQLFDRDRIAFRIADPEEYLCRILPNGLRQEAMVFSHDYLPRIELSIFD